MPAVWHHQQVYAAQKGGFSRSGRPEQRDHLPRLDVQVDVTEHRQSAEAFAQSRNLDLRCHRSYSIALREVIFCALDDNGQRQENDKIYNGDHGVDFERAIGFHCNKLTLIKKVWHCEN